MLFSRLRNVGLLAARSALKKPRAAQIEESCPKNISPGTTQMLFPGSQIKALEKMKCLTKKSNRTVASMANNIRW
jgi:hypothetical protein